MLLRKIVIVPDVPRFNEHKLLCACAHAHEARIHNSTKNRDTPIYLSIYLIEKKERKKKAAVSQRVTHFCPVMKNRGTLE